VSLRIKVYCLVVALAPIRMASAQAPPAPSPFTCTMLASQRTQDVGCYIVGSETLTSLPEGPLFWHLYAYPTLDAATRAKGTSTGVAVESLGKAWLFTIATHDWHPASGERIAVVGPLTIVRAKRYEVRYLETVQPAHPTGHTPVHRHPGVEAWYVEKGQHCMQIPGKTRMIHAGETDVVPPGVPMMLTPGDAEWHVTLVLFDADQPWMTKAADWTPTTPCGQ
jgi:quercetin dioxygenase-like cupin family protein